jgi:hypothetical protein
VSGDAQLIGTRVHPEDMHLVDDMVRQARADARDFNYEYRLQMPDNAVKFLHLVAHGAGDEDGRLEYIGAVQDVTQRRISDGALAKARSELAHVARVKSMGVLTASIAHALATDPPTVEGARETTKNDPRWQSSVRCHYAIARTFSKRNATTEFLDL